jgi:hypothetical protein
MSVDEIRDIIKRELPRLVQGDKELQDLILRLSRREFAARAETNDRFDRLLDELRKDREEQARKWEKNQEEQSRRWDEQAHKWHEQARMWEKNQDEQGRRWDEQARKWDEQARMWEENQKRFDEVHEEIMAQAKKFDRSIGALGARWGIQSESAFRNALAGILEQNFGVQVINVNEFDDQGVVFGRPEQIELDVIIRNGLLLICELKSSMSKSDMYIFERKARFYEKMHDRKADRLIVISPMIEPKAQKVAEKLGIETYSDSEDVETL